MPKLRFVGLRDCKLLTYRTLHCPPCNLDGVDLFKTVILDLPPGGVSARGGDRRLRSLWVEAVEYPRFEHLIELFAGETIEEIEMSFSRFRKPTDLFYLLERTKKLTLLQLVGATGLEDNDFETKARITGLTHHPVEKGIFEYKTNLASCASHRLIFKSTLSQT